MLKMLMSLLVVSSLFVACTNEKQIGDMLKKNPKILTDAIKENPVAFIDALNDAVKAAQGTQKKRQEEEEKKKLEDSFNNPMVPEIRDNDILRGTAGAPIVLVEYSDFECPFCSRGYQTVVDLLKKYEGKIQFIYKHLPLSFHPNAMPAAQYMEAIRLQSVQKASKFHDLLFERFSKIKQGEKFFRSVAKELNVNMKKLEADLESDAVKNRIAEDLAEAKKYGFQGTPGFLINGIPVKGAYPASHFETIVEELKKRGKLSL